VSLGSFQSPLRGESSKTERTAHYITKVKQQDYVGHASLALSFVADRPEDFPENLWTPPTFPLDMSEPSRPQGSGLWKVIQAASWSRMPRVRVFTSMNIAAGVHYFGRGATCWTRANRSAVSTRTLSSSKGPANASCASMTVDRVAWRPFRG